MAWSFTKRRSEAKPLPTPNYTVRLRRGIDDVGVAGEQHHAAAIAEALAGRDDPNWVVVALVHEPQNAHDPAAVRVDIVTMAGHFAAGYLPYDVAPLYRDALRPVWETGGMPLAPAKVWFGSPVPQLYIKMATPDRVVPPKISDPRGEFVDGNFDLTVVGEDAHQAHLDDYPVKELLVFGLGESEIPSGKYKGQPTFTVHLDGKQVGHFTRRMADKHEAAIHPVFRSGHIPYLAGRLELDHRGLQVILDAPMPPEFMAPFVF